MLSSFKQSLNVCLLNESFDTSDNVSTHNDVDTPTPMLIERLKKLWNNCSADDEADNHGFVVGRLYKRIMNRPDHDGDEVIPNPGRAAPSCYSKSWQIKSWLQAFKEGMWAEDDMANRT